MADVEVEPPEASDDGDAASVTAGAVSAAAGAAPTTTPTTAGALGPRRGCGLWRPSSSSTSRVPSRFITAPAPPVCRRSCPWS